MSARIVVWFGTGGKRCNNEQLALRRRALIKNRVDRFPTIVTSAIGSRLSWVCADRIFLIFRMVDLA
jgi:hypothetical protein